MEKKIHYIWLGGAPKPNIMDICINSWREKLLDYEIIEWNEKNLNFYEEIERNRFLKECYERKLWAFLSDYFRIKVLYEHGGIYLDSDMQIIKKLDGFLNDDLFFGLEDENQISAGIIGAKKKNPFILEILKFYEKDIWEKNFYTIPSIIQYLFKVKKPKKIKLYKSEYFYPYHYTEEFKYTDIKKETHGIHWWGKSWHENKKKLYFLEFKHIKGWKKIVINILILSKTLEPIRKFYEKFIKKKVRK